MEMNWHDHDMDPNNINYSKIDPVLRSLIKDINATPWAKTTFSCGGPAQHDNDSEFYLVVEVHGRIGIYNLARWLGYVRKMVMNQPLHDDIVKCEAVLLIPNLEPGPLMDIFAGACMGSEWFRFRIYFEYLDGPAKKEAVTGIRQLRLSLKKVGT
jgi:hypothetical protein